MRVSTAFNLILAVPGAWVRSVEVRDGVVVVALRRRFRRLTCPVCNLQTASGYDTRPRSWRHLDLGACKCYLTADIRRLLCRRCGKVVTESVPWARPKARFTRDFEAVVAWLAQRCDKTTVTRKLRCSWRAVRDIVVRVVADSLDDTRFDGLRRIGVDEVSYRKGHRFLTIVADHDRGGAVIWAGEGRSSSALTRFYDQLGPTRCAALTAVSLDMGAPYANATRKAAGQARQCIDPFHVIQLANKALDEVRRWAWNQHRRSQHDNRWARGAPVPGTARWIKNTRWALLKDPDALNDSQRDILDQLRRVRSAMYRAWQIKEGLRDLYKLNDPTAAAAHLDAWLARACRSRIPAIVKLSRTIRQHRDGILAAIELGLSNSKLEGLASKIRLINHRGYGHHSADALIAMIYLCAGGITIHLPTKT